MVVENSVLTSKLVVKDPSSSDGVDAEAQLSDADLVKKPLLYDGDVVKDVVLSSKDMVKQLVFDSNDPLLSDVSVVENVVYSDGDIMNDPLWSDGNVVGVTVPSGVQCTDVGNSVLCSSDAVRRNRLAGDMGVEDVSLSYERYEPACCNFCVMYHSVTSKAQSKRSGISEVDLTDSRSSKMECAKDFSLCSVEYVEYCESCKECTTEPCEDTGWKENGRTSVKNEDLRCNWRRRRRCLVWWLLLLFLGAAPLASGQLSPRTDISTSHAEGGEFIHSFIQ